MLTITIKSKKHGEKQCFYDEFNHHIVSVFKWCLAKHRNTFYAISRGVRPDGKIGTIRMHRLFLSGDIIDHRDNNGLNNCLSNLRSVTSSQNSQNRGPTKTTKTGYKGVYKAKNRFRAVIRDTPNNRVIHLGSFNTAEEAALKFNEVATVLHGEFARLNSI